jgi:hypothetical protein
VAISFVRNSGQVATTSPLGGGAVSLPITAGAVGNTLVVAVATAAATGAASCSDSSGTTYTLDAEITSGVAITVMVFSAQITTAGVTSISINGFGASLLVEAAAFEFSGIKTTGRLDTKGTGSGIGTAVSAGPTSANLLEGDSWVGVFGSTASLGTFTAGGSATGLTGADQTGGSLGAEYLLAPTAGSKATATGTFSTTGTWAGLLAAYVAAPAPAAVPLNASAGSSGGSLAATAPTKVALNAAAGGSGGSLFLDAHLDLAPAAGTSGGTLAALASYASLVLAAGSSGALLPITAPTQVPLAAGAARSEAGGPAPQPEEALYPGEELSPGQPSLPLTAPTGVVLSAASASSGGAFTATTNAPVPLNAGSGQSTGTLTVNTTGNTALEPAVASSAGSLGVTAKTQVALNPAAGSSSGSLFLNAHIDMHASEGIGGGALGITAATRIALSSSSATGGGTLGATVTTYLALNPSTGVSGGTLHVITVDLQLAPASAVSEAGGPFLYPSGELFPGEEYPGLTTLPIHAPTYVVLGAANATSGARKLGLNVKRPAGRSNPKQRLGQSNPNLLVGA